MSVIFIVITVITTITTSVNKTRTPNTPPTPLTHPHLTYTTPLHTTRQDDRWGEEFTIPWRESVLSSTDTASLMQSQIMLEYGVKTGWFTPGGVKLLGSLPSRAQSLRSPSVGLLALRLWTLDRAIRYDKVTLPGEKCTGNGSMNRGRPKGVGNNPTGSRKKKKTF